MGKFRVKSTPTKPIPSPPDTMDGFEFFAAMQDILNEGMGQMGDPGKKFITLDDLLDPELVKYLNSQPVSVTRPAPASTSKGVATDNIPDAPRNLEVLSTSKPLRLGAFCNHLKWTNPVNDVDEIAGVEIWSAQTQNRSDASFTALVTYPTNKYQHGSTNPSATYYYWIRAVNWAGLYSEWEPSSDQGGLVVKGSATVGETAQKIINALKGEATALYVPATEYQIGDQVTYECDDGNIRCYECIRDEEDLITDGELAVTELGGTDRIVLQVNRDFSGASNWTNGDINAYNETGDLTITADAAGQYCTLPDANAILQTKLYKMTFEVANLVSNWRIADEDDSFTILQEVIEGTNTAYFFYNGSAGGGLRIISSADDSSADFDNFSIKVVKFTNWTRNAPWVPGTDIRYTSPLQATISAVKEEAYCNGSQVIPTSLSQAGATFTQSTDYIVRFTVRDYEAGTITPYVDGTAGTARSANGNWQETITAGAAGGLVFTASADFVGTIDNLIAIPSTGGTGITGHNPEYYYPLLWKRIGIISTGDIDGDATVGIDGNLVVDGSILARHVGVDTLSAVTANLGTVTAGVAKSEDDKFKIDFNERWLKVWDAAGTLRVHLGFIED